jgi:DNA-binding response OmpR family regulator
MLPKPSLLLIEDDPFAQRLVAAVAERAGFAASSVATGEEALEIADRIPIDLIVVDLNLPDAEGLSVIEQLRKRLHLADVPFLVCSGNVNVDTISAAARMGALQFVRKPLDLFELQRRLEGSLGKVPERWATLPRVMPRGGTSPRDLDERLKATRIRLAEVVALLYKDTTEPLAPAEQPASDVATAEASPESPESRENQTDGAVAHEAADAGVAVEERGEAATAEEPVRLSGRSLEELLPGLRLAALDVGAVRLDRFLGALTNEASDAPTRKELRVALKVELAAFDRRLAR